MASHVWLHNPDTDALWQSPTDYAPIARERGWVDSDGPVDSEATDETASASDAVEVDEQTGFDPSAHKSAEVNAYLDQYRDTAPGEVDRVLALERAGKNRKTVTGGITGDNA